LPLYHELKINEAERRPSLILKCIGGWQAFFVERHELAVDDGFVGIDASVVTMLRERS
jgi:hypothetical protein